MSCRDLIKESFQNIDETILDYVECTFNCICFRCNLESDIRCLNVERYKGLLSHVNLFTVFAALVKESEDDLKSPDDVYGAIGGLLKDIDSNKADEDIVEICEELFLLMTGYVENWLKPAE